MSTPLTPAFGRFDLGTGSGGKTLPPSARPPNHRHGSPSGPWPWLDLNDHVNLTQILARSSVPPDLDDWKSYPQSLFPNWSSFQQEKSGIKGVINQRRFSNGCTVFRLDITEDARFHYNDDEENDLPWEWTIHDKARRYDDEGRKRLWRDLHIAPPPDARLRAFFIDHLSGPVLQMLGTRYNIEPFYWSSSLKWIPARFQSQVTPGVGDHITIILPYIRTLPNPQATAPPSPGSSYTSLEQTIDFVQEQVIDTQGPLALYYSQARILIPDLLALHVVRRNRASGELSTLISYHPPSQVPYRRTTAETLHGRLFAAGQSVYWSKIFTSTVPSGDPTFVTLAMLWYAMYAWDEALEELVGEVSALESQTLLTLASHDLTYNLTHHLHLVRAHLLHYEGLLEIFRKSVFFLVRCSPHPGADQSPTSSRSASRLYSPTSGRGQRSAMSVLDLDHPPRSTVDTDSIAEGILPQDQDDEDEESVADEEDEVLSQPGDDASEFEKLLNKEATNLVHEIERLQMTRNMLDKRLGNVMGLAFSSVNIEDSRRMSKLTEATVRDSAAMKQLSYLTMFYLPASFVAAVFGMNIPEVNPGTTGTLPHYFAVAVPLTVVTVWIIMLQYRRSKERAQRKAQEGQPFEVVAGQGMLLSGRLGFGEWRSWLPCFGRGRRQRRLSEKDISSTRATRASSRARSRSRPVSRRQTMNGETLTAVQGP